MCSVSFSLFHSLAPTCRILLLDFTLFSYTFACFTHYASRHFSGSTSSRGLLLQPALLLRCRVNLRSCLRLLLLVLLFLCMSRIFAASRLLRLCGDRYHDVISHCAHKRDIHFLHVLCICLCVCALRYVTLVSVRLCCRCTFFKWGSLRLSVCQSVCLPLLLPLFDPPHIRLCVYLLS